MDVVAMPQLGETVTEGTIIRWAKTVGDRVEIDDGETVPIGTPVAILTATEDEAVGHEPAEEPFLSPAVRRLIHEHGLDPEQIEGSGRQGRITRADVLAVVESEGEIVPFDRVRGEVGYLPFVTRAFVDALRAHPQFNGIVEEDRVVRQAGIHIGFAVDLGDALVVAVSPPTPTSAAPSPSPTWVRSERSAAPPSSTADRSPSARSTASAGRFLAEVRRILETRDWTEELP